MPNKHDISVACCWWGKWPEGEVQIGVQYVNKLYRMTQKYITVPHRFICFTDRPHLSPAFDSGIEVASLVIPEKVMHLFGLYHYDSQKYHGDPTLGHFPKLNMYRSDNGLTGRVLGMDLDVILTKDITEFVLREEPFIIRKTFSRRRQSRRTARQIGGGMVSFQAGHYSHFWQWLTKNSRRMVQKFQGDEREFYANVVPQDDLHFWQDLFPGQFIRLKQIRSVDTAPQRAAVIATTGRPFLHQIDHPVVQEYWHNV